MKFLINSDISNKSVLIRLDLDVPVENGAVADDTRLQDGLPTLEFVADRASRTTVIGHLGEPRGRVEACSLKPIQAWIRERLPNVDVWENLRFDPREKTKDGTLAYDIVRRSGAQTYVFDAFAVSHRAHASVVEIPKLIPTVVGFRFEQELAELEKAAVAPKRPFVVVLGGAKVDTKLPIARKLAQVADDLLLGGLFPRASSMADFAGFRARVRFAELAPDGLDITEESATEFSRIISQAGTVVWNGPMGAFEESANRLTEQPINALTHQPINESNVLGTSAWGTYVVAKAVSSTPAYTLVGGGDTEAALTRFGLESGIDWISSGGGAMLHYLAYRTLPLLEATGERHP